MVVATSHMRGKESDPITDSSTGEESRDCRGGDAESVAPEADSVGRSNATMSPGDQEDTVAESEQTRRRKPV